MLGSARPQKARQTKSKVFHIKETCSQIIRPGRPKSQLRILLRNFTTKFGSKYLAVASQKRTKSHFLSHRRIFHRNQHDCRPSLSYFSLFSRLKTNLKGRHSDTIEVIQTESQAMLNFLTEHEFQDAFK
jgi:hypothetical protein